MQKLDSPVDPSLCLELQAELNQRPMSRVEDLLYLFSSFTVGAAILNSDSQIIICNHRFSKLLEISWKVKLVDEFGELKHIFRRIGRQDCQTIHWLQEKQMLICLFPINLLMNKKMRLCFVFDQAIDDVKQIKSREMKKLIKELDAIIDAISEGVWVCDGEGNVLRVNPVSEEMNNVLASDVVGKNMKELEDKGYFKGCATLDAIRLKKTVTNLVPLQRTNTMVIATATPFFDDKGNISMVVGTERDISKLEDQHHFLREQEYLRNSVKDHINELKKLNRVSHDFIAKSKSMVLVLNQLVKVSSVDSTVLILGESGVGKTAIADLIHKNSNRSENSFFAINCSSIPETLLESELFGYVQGAFTGARKGGKVGLIEMADGGTLFLDEISELSFASQAKLLKFLDEGVYFRVGCTEKRTVDVRVVAATNQDLQTLVDEGTFRLDLYYRLNVISIRIPPLRERQECIVSLLKHYVDYFSGKLNIRRVLSPRVFSILASYEFPGNVRELINICERIAVMTDKEYIMPLDLPPQVLETLNKDKFDILEPNKGESLPEMMARIEKQVLLKTRTACGSQQKMAQALGVTQPTINRKLKKYGLENRDRVIS